tara:strand:+ start:1186 stop:2199 length:1014 start_codon:yes stop_codon:yes gene_type:complete
MVKKIIIILSILIFSSYSNLLASEEQQNTENVSEDDSELNNLLEKNKTLEEELNNLKDELEIIDELKQKNNQLENIKIIEINRSILIIFFVTIIFSILVILILSIIISRQRKWRQKYFDENLGKNYIAQLPENIADSIENSASAYNNLNENNRLQYDNFQKNLSQVVALINQFNSISSDNVSKINEQLSDIRKFSDEKNELVKKYQEFYDLSILKSFVFEIISAIDNLEDSLKKITNDNIDPASIDAVSFAKDQLVNLLENENIIQVSPDLSLKYNDEKQPIRMKALKSIPTDNENMIGDIQEVLHSGYSGIIGKDEVKLIREAYVSIYISNNKEEN